jgi:hypothetical protein
MRVESATVLAPSTHVDALKFLQEIATAMETKSMPSACVAVHARLMRTAMARVTMSTRV